MKIRVLFYKAKWGDKSIVDNLISLWTRSKYSHCEIWIATDEGLFENAYERFAEGFQYWGTCYTSTMRGDHNGTVKRDACGVLKNPDRWDYIEEEVIAQVYATLIIWMNLVVEQNEGYSMWDLLKFLSPVHFPDNNRYICSEFCNDAIWYILDNWKGGIISPKRLHIKLTKLGLETVSLVKRIE